MMNDAIIRPTLIYIIRLWAESDQGVWVWRVSLQAVQPRDSHLWGFATLAEATIFLQTQMSNIVPVNKEI
jgi:hypothetical protein